MLVLLLFFTLLNPAVRELSPSLLSSSLPFIASPTVFPCVLTTAPSG